MSCCPTRKKITTSSKQAIHLHPDRDICWELWNSDGNPNVRKQNFTWQQTLRFWQGCKQLYTTGRNEFLSDILRRLCRIWLSPFKSQMSFKTHCHRGMLNKSGKTGVSAPHCKETLSQWLLKSNASALKEAGIGVRSQCLWPWWTPHQVFAL